MAATPGPDLVLVVIGTVAVGLTNRNARGRLSGAGMALSVLTALATAGYSLADRAAMPPGQDGCHDRSHSHYALVEQRWFI